MQHTKLPHCLTMCKASIAALISARLFLAGSFLSSGLLTFLQVRENVSQFKQIVK